ncbi:MAG: tetracycline resistance efflux system leader peptide [Halothece sp.]
MFVFCPLFLVGYCNRVQLKENLKHW